MAQKVNLLEIEIGHKIDGDVWIQAGAPNTNAWYITHSEGEPSKVEEDGVELTEKGSVVLCHGTASTWYWNSANNRLYIHTSGSDDPAGASYIILSYFWEYYTDKQFEGSEEIVFNGHYYLSYLTGSIPNITQRVTSFLLGAYSMDFGGLTLINADGRFDSRLSDYIYEAKKVIFKHGNLGDIYGSYIDFWRGWTGKVALNDNELGIDTEDLRASVE